MKILQSQRGSALLISFLVLSLVSVIALWSTNLTTVETRISANDRLYKKGFYEAEGGVETGIELVEQNIDLRGFCQDIPTATPCYVGNVFINARDFYLNDPPTDPANDIPSSTNRDLTLPRAKAATASTPPVTNVRIWGESELAHGGAIQMIAGYEGKGKGAAGGGVWRIYNIRSRHLGADNSGVRINLGWRHVD